MSSSHLPPTGDDPIGGWSVEDAAAEQRSPTEVGHRAGRAADPPTPKPRPRRPKKEPPPVERRPRPAGHALVVVVVALLASLFLNAPGLHKSAHSLEDGWQRDVALAVTGPLDGVSHALLLDRPRAAVKSTLGRSADDTIDTDVSLPASGPATTAPTPGTKAKKAFTREKPLRLWVAGDSLVVVPAESIVRAAGASPVIEPVGGIDGRVATGLERPDVFNWFRHIPERLRELRPGVVVLGFGGNDDHSYMTGLPEGVTIDGFDTPSWRREYGRRAGGLMDAAARAEAFVVWIGLPITRDPEQTRRFDAINAVVAAQARRRPGRALYVDTYTTFASDTGGFTEYLEDTSGRLIKVRAADGVHFERAGGDMIAREVLRELNRVFDLTSWRKRAAGQPTA